MSFRFAAPFALALLAVSPALAERLELQVAEAQQGFDAESSQPLVSIRLADDSARAFARFTSENVRRPVDIAIDGKVVLTPFINEPILAGTIEIRGLRSAQKATELAVRLRSGTAALAVEPRE